MEQKPPCIDLAKNSDLDTFVLPTMTPDEIDDFITYLFSAGYDVKKFSSAGNSFKKNTYISFLRFQAEQVRKSK